ncbi:MAG: ribose-phosphate diphosphokinase [Spirochaetaceae bacterium]|jgi:ribose-phosphate pyrophosphokinase|nr:ribose-phosphate diphosphokinase [Spirochaetaceae bacterium]
MSYSNPTNLAIIACPGGENFADKLIKHLVKGYTRNFERTISNMSRRFTMAPDLVRDNIRFINEVNDASATDQNGKCYQSRLKVPVHFFYFANGEIKAEIQEPVRGRDVYIVQDIENHYPVNFNGTTTDHSLSVNDHLMTVFVTVDAARQSGAKQITVVLPIYPYSRQHKKKGREGLTASRVGKILEFLGVNRIITLDLHSREIANSFNTLLLENLHASYQIIRQLMKLPDILENLVVVSPDTGAVDRNKFYATTLKKPLALLYKERDYSRVSKDAVENNIIEVKLLGNVEGKTVFMADDMLGTGGTLLKAMASLKEKGAGKVIAAISLPLFSGDAIAYFDEAYRNGLFYRIIGTNAIYHEEVVKREWYISVNITGLFAQIIAHLHQNLPLSPLLDNRDIIEKLVSEVKKP